MLSSFPAPTVSLDTVPRGGAGQGGPGQGGEVLQSRQNLHLTLARSSLAFTYLDPYMLPP